MTGETPRRGPGPLRMGGSLAVIDEDRHRADAVSFGRSQVALQAGRVEEAMALLAPLAATPSTTVRAQAAIILAVLTVDDTPADALALLDRIPPHGVVVDRGLLAMVRSQSLRHLGRHVEAVTAAREAWMAAPSTERALVLTAALVAAGLPGEAVPVLESARRGDPDAPALLGQLAGALALAGRPDDADTVIVALDALAAVADAEWQRQRAWALACREQVAAAREALTQAAVLDDTGTRRFLADAPLLAERGVSLS